MDEPLDRNRRFVLLALASLVPSPACFLFATTPPPPLVPPMPVPEAIAALGRRYLAAYPNEANRETLRRILHLEPSDSAVSQLPRIDAAIRRELEDRDVVHIEGWQLTRTECRIYAALALS